MTWPLSLLYLILYHPPPCSSSTLALLFLKTDMLFPESRTHPGYSKGCSLTLFKPLLGEHCLGKAFLDRFVEIFEHWPLYFLSSPLPCLIFLHGNNPIFYISCNLLFFFMCDYFLPPECKLHFLLSPQHRKCFLLPWKMLPVTLLL